MYNKGMRGKKNNLDPSSRRDARGIYQNPVDDSFSNSEDQAIHKIAETIINKPINMQHLPSIKRAQQLLEKQYFTTERMIAYAAMNKSALQAQVEGTAAQLRSLQSYHLAKEARMTDEELDLYNKYKALQANEQAKLDVLRQQLKEFDQKLITATNAKNELEPILDRFEKLVSVLQRASL